MVEKGFTLAELAKHIGAQLKNGDPYQVVTGIAPLPISNSQQISFLQDTRYRRYLPDTKAAAVILNEQHQAHCPVAVLLHSNPYLAYAKASQLFDYYLTPVAGIHPTAQVGQDCVIADSAVLDAHVVIGNGVHVGEATVVGAGSVLGHNVRIGKNTRLYPKVTVYDACELGDDVIVHSGAVIGSDGFGFANDKGQWIKITQLGKVKIGSAVEIGANTTIDRGALGDTKIGFGVKIDNQVHIAHNVVIDDHTAIAGCVGISGGVKIGKYCMIGGGVGIAGHLSLADGVVVTGMTLVSHSLLEKGMYSSGTAIDTNRKWRRNAVHFRHLNAMAERIAALETQVQTLLKKES